MRMHTWPGWSIVRHRVSLAWARPTRCAMAVVRCPAIRTSVGAVLLAMVTVALVGADEPSAASDLRPELEAVLTRELHFSRADLLDLEHGKIVKRTLPPVTNDEVGVAGAVRVSGSRERLIDAYRDIVTFKKSPSILEIGRFSHPPLDSDLDALTTTRDDFDLRRCRVANCDIRLPASAIQHFATSVDWRTPEAEAHASTLFKHLLLAHVRSYAAGGPGLITEYDDDRTPILPGVAGDDLIRTSPYLDALKPGLAAHLTCFWSSPLEGAEDFLYWTKEKFGFAPFISVTHVTIVASSPHQSIATSRDVYSSRYIDGSLSMMIASDSAADAGAFYLVYVNRSRVSALRGPMASLRRSLVEHKTRGTLENTLRDIRARIGLSGQ
jgi:hypothetical protein